MRSPYAFLVEGKIVGLAAFGDPKPLYDAFKRALRISPDGSGFESDFSNMERAIDKRKAYIAAMRLFIADERSRRAAKYRLHAFFARAKRIWTSKSKRQEDYLEST